MHCYWLPLPEERELVVGGATAPTLAMVSRGESFDLRGGVGAITPHPSPLSEERELVVTKTPPSKPPAPPSQGGEGSATFHQPVSDSRSISSYRTPRGIGEHMSSIKQDEARRANSLKSTGPKTEEGKARSRLNAVKHGATGKLVLPDEDIEAFRARIAGFKESLETRNPLEEELASRAGEASWRLDRANRAEDARLTRNILTERATAAAAAAENAAALGQRLFHDRRGATSLYPSLDYAPNQPQTSWSGLAEDPDDPSRLVKRLEGSLAGCRWLRLAWSALKARLDSGQGWQSPDKFMCIRLMGRQPLDAADFPEVAEVFLACHAIEPQFEYPFRELRCDIHADLYKRYKDRLSRRNLEAITPANPTAARAVLLALVEKATERLRQLEAEHQEVADIVDELQADILAFDDTKGGENLRRLSGSCNRLLLRNVEAVHKGRREMGGGGGGGRGKKRSGRLLMVDENGTTRYVDDYERE